MKPRHPLMLSYTPRAVNGDGSLDRTLDHFGLDQQCVDCKESDHRGKDRIRD
jgi:hypothetical protein